ncbi:MAG: Spy/CpxP family protein refolding chaperone [Acetobacteraceae bacterium]|nr:Spy/CpxP family protein refolding chaperone [Acetobacteraceae bacterium]
MDFRLTSVTLLCALALTGCQNAQRVENAAFQQSPPGKITQIDPNWVYEPRVQIEDGLRRIHDQLGITPAQEPQWQAFAQQVASSSHQFNGTVSSLRQTDPQLMTYMSGRRIQEARMTVYDQVQPAYDQLYRVMTPSQRMQFNNLIVGPRSQTCGLLCQVGVIS